MPTTQSLLQSLTIVGELTVSQFNFWAVKQKWKQLQGVNAPVLMGPLAVMMLRWQTIN